MLNRKAVHPMELPLQCLERGARRVECPLELLTLPLGTPLCDAGLFLPRCVMCYYDAFHKDAMPDGTPPPKYPMRAIVVPFDLLVVNNCCECKRLFEVA